MMARSCLNSAVLAFLCIALVAGCGGGGGGDEPDADAETDADDATETGPDSVDDVEPETVGDDSVTFIVVTYEDGTAVPLEGCTVAFDMPGGGRLE